MSISLPNTKKEKADRLIMLVKQGSITMVQANKLFTDYCRLYEAVKQPTKLSPNKKAFRNIRKYKQGIKII